MITFLVTAGHFRHRLEIYCEVLVKNEIKTTISFYNSDTSQRCIT